MRLAELRSREPSMKNYQCDICGYVYEPANGDPGASIPPNTAFESLPADWVCPTCGAGKDQFTAVG
jgi:rubredoxin